MIIIGIDPGSRSTGYGVIRVEGNQNHHLAEGRIQVTAIDLRDRLQQIFQGVQAIVQCYLPHEAAIEQVFMHQNPNAALKLGQARGAALVALNIPVAEYSARQVKQSVVGYGAAKKEQVQHMVARLLNLSRPLQADAADALAIALCHAHARTGLHHRLGVRVSSSRSKRTYRWRDYQPVG